MLTVVFHIEGKQTVLERLHKLLARAGVAALRPAEDMILEGRVTVNGRVVRELGARADAETDVITVDGTPVDVPRPTDPRQYVMLHKPVGVISTAHDPHGRPTVVDIVPNGSRIFPVGRLDADSEGLILLTDDGDLAYRLTHPRFEVDKEYRVLVDQTPQLPDLRRWRTGVELDNEMTAPAWVEVLDRAEDGTWLRIVMREGRKRQIREVARLLGMNVRRLIRVREGPLALADLAPAAWRVLTQSEVESLRAHTQHVPSREADEERERRMSEEGNRRRRLRVVRRPARDEAETARPAQESTSPFADESSEHMTASNDSGFGPEYQDGDDISPSEQQAAPERRERSRFDQGRPQNDQGRPQNDQGDRGGARFGGREDNRQDRGGRDDRGFGGPNRPSQGDRAPYRGRDDRQQRPNGEQSGRPDDRNRPAYGNERNSGGGQNRAPYGNDRNRSGGGFRDRNAPSGSGGGFRSGPSNRDRSGPMYGGTSRDRSGPSGGGFRDRNAPSGGGYRDRSGPSSGGFRSGPSNRDRSGPMYGGTSRDRNAPSGGGFRDRSGPSGGGFRDRNAPSSGGFRSGPSNRDRSGPMYGGTSRDRSGPSGGGFRDRNAPSGGGYRDRSGPSGWRLPRP